MVDGLMLIERAGPVAICHLDHPPANAIDLAFAGELESRFSELLARDDLGAIVLTGKGKFFCGGLDLKAVPAYGPEEQRALINTVNRVVAKLYGCPVPVVAAVNGHAIAGGLVLALTSDYRVGTRAPCLLGLTEARVGIPFPAGPLAVLKAELAPAVLRTLTLGARSIGSEAALDKGILDELQAPDDVLPRALEMATDLASIPKDAYRVIKDQLRGETVAWIRSVSEKGVDPMLKSWLAPGSRDRAAAALRAGKAGGA